MKTGVAMRNGSRLAGVLLAAYAALVVKNAWLGDDAYITLRTVENFTAGRGLVFNPAERVDAFTHPLWALVLAALHRLTGETYFMTIALSVVCSVAAAVVIWRATRGAGRLAGLTLLIASKAYVDYSTSGLENPLTHLLVAMFLARFLAPGDPADRLRPLALLAGLVAVNRLDALVVLLPALGWCIARRRSLAAVGEVAIGMTPVVLWTVFSLFYYGFPVPNTVYAKLETGREASLVVERGVSYLLDSLRMDPWTLVLVAAGTVLALVLRGRARAVAAGAVLYLAYVVWIGGDFMSGRFVALPYLMCAVLVAANMDRLKPRVLIPAGAALAASLLVSGRAHLFSGPRYGDVPLTPTPVYGSLPLSLIRDGICDERAFYYQATGLLRARPGPPQHVWFDQGARARAAGWSPVVWPWLGFFGEAAGPEVHVVDPLGLADPLLARLPAAPSESRAGHVFREIPAGYIESLARNENLLDDSDLRPLYDAIRLATRSSLFAKGRLAAIWKLNTRGFDAAIAAYAARVRAIPQQ